MQPSKESPIIVDATQNVIFTFDGKEYSGFQGDTLASALYRAGVRVFSRSFKYHRPRGLMCVSGACPNCLVNVSGTPNERACMTPVKDGARVTSQNAWPSLETDLMSVFDRLDAFLPVGFYYKTFIRPRSMWPLYEKVLRNAAGLGEIDPSPHAAEEKDYDKHYRHAEVTVVGGGPAGMSAALAAAALGARVILIDENPHLGGHLRYCRAVIPPDLSNYSAFVTNGVANSTDLGQKLVEAVNANKNIDLLLGATAFGWYEGNLLGVVQDDRLIKLRTGQLVVATGRIEQPLIFENNDLPGVFLGSGLQRLMHLYDVRPGARALVVTNNDYGWRVAGDLLAMGVEVTALADTRPNRPETSAASQVSAAGVPVFAGYTIQKARGGPAVEGASLIRLSETGTPLPETQEAVSCDLIAVSTGFVANNALIHQSGGRIVHDPDRDVFTIASFSPGVLGAGHALGDKGIQALLLGGRAAGLEAALHTNRLNGGVRPEGQASLTSLKQQLERARIGAQHKSTSSHLTSFPSQSKKKFICYCEDVTEVDLLDAMAEGFDDIETLKRYSTVSMGPCQGKMCSLNTIRVCAEGNGRSIAETGRTTSRPPFVPVKLGLLAGRKLEPVRLTPMHHRHLALDAKMMNAGQWLRPEHYGDAHAEVMGVHQRVGLIDVSTLGKIELRGPHSLPFLERIYTAKFADLPVGRLRYGLMCSEEGVIFDDGVVGRLADDHYYVTTTTGGLSPVYEWLAWWLAAWDYQLDLFNVTMDYAAVNLAGPLARETLQKLVAIELSNRAFPYMHLQQAQVAGIPARLMRIGFVGELGYEIHIPAQYGDYLWEALMAAGSEFGIMAFGVEAQRVLRLEKGHLIVGQDTDALTDPFGAGLGWSVKLDKGDFIGKAMLAFRRQRGLRDQLVKFEMLDPTVVPGEGEQIVEGGRFIGRVTSARYSPTLAKSIGMAWVPVSKAPPGTKLRLRVNGSSHEALVVGQPFFDPAGSRLRM
ncbi:MAG TPA: 2Fe-2S iron-sulfur cluster-binding protein [Anaerolineales bacterium]